MPPNLAKGVTATQPAMREVVSLEVGRRQARQVQSAWSTEQAGGSKLKYQHKGERSLATTPHSEAWPVWNPSPTSAVSLGIQLHLPAAADG